MTAILLVISDVDGTLVTPDKQITKASARAAQLLYEKGIGLTVVSSRPPVGLRMLVEPLSLQLPMGAFSGGTVVSPDLAVIEQHFVPTSAARQTADVLAAFGVDIWLYTARGWLVRDPAGHYIANERRTIRADPLVVSDFSTHFENAFKIVGSSRDFARLAECETAVREALGLDITAPGRDKGTFLESLSKRLAVPPPAIAVVGDGNNDLAMFRKAGMSIAMGNAGEEVKARATHSAAANTEDGFARAIEQYVIGGAM